MINDNGGTKIATDFSFKVNGGSATAFQQDGGDTLKGKNTLTVNAGTYNVTEPAVYGYTTTYSYCSNIQVGNGQTKTCTITNDDQPGTIVVIKNAKPAQGELRVHDDRHGLHRVQPDRRHHEQRQQEHPDPQRR